MVYLITFFISTTLTYDEIYKMMWLKWNSKEKYHNARDSEGEMPYSANLQPMKDHVVLYKTGFCALFVLSFLLQHLPLWICGDREKGWDSTYHP
jgi:hypothetical protein